MFLLSRTRLPWPGFVSMASNHLVIPSVYVQLRENGLLQLLHEIISDHLQKIQELNLERNNAILRQSEGIIEILAAENIQLLFLKGVGNIFDKLYSDTGERMIQDIDVMVHPDQWESAVEYLKKEGYRNREILDSTAIPPRKHYPRLLRNDSTASVELHRFPVALKYAGSFTPELVWEKKVPAANMSSCFVMCNEHKAVHNFIHSQLEHKGHFYGRIFMRSLYDHLLLSGFVDMDKVFSMAGHDFRKPAAYMEVAGRTFGLVNKLQRYGLSQTGLYPLRHELFLRSVILSTGMRVIVRIFRSYVLTPAFAITDAALRKKIIGNLKDKKWYGKHLRSYKKYLR